MNVTSTFRYLCSGRRMAALKLNLIAACDSQMGIGLKSDLPWRLRNEMAYFNRMTNSVSKDAATASGESKKNVVVMGRKTWDSVPHKFRPLKGRINVVLSRNKPKEEDGENDVIWTASWEELEERLAHLEQKGQIGKIWIIGGSFLYKLAVESKHCHRIYLTRIKNDYGCDVFFPNFDEDVFRIVKDPDVPDVEQEENNVKYSYFVYEKAN